MADKKVLLEVELNMTDALKEMAAYEIKIDEITAREKELREELKTNSRQTDEERRRYVELKQQLSLLNEEKKAYRKEIGEVSRGVQNQIISENKYKDTLKGLCAQLSKAKDELRAMKLSDPGFEAKTKEVEALNSKVKEMEEAYGVYTRNVGNYEGALKSLKEEIRAHTDALVALKLQGDENSEAYRQHVEELARLKDAQADINQQVNASASDTRSLDTLSNSLTTLTAGFAAYQSIVGLSTKESEEYKRIVKNMQAATVALQAAIQLQNAAQKQSNIYQAASNVLRKVGIDQTVRATKAEAAHVAMQKAETTGAKAAAAAQWLWNAALAANPVYLLLAALALLVAGVVLVTKAIGGSQSAMDKAKKSSEEYERQTRKTDQAITKINANLIYQQTTIVLAYDKEIAAMLKSGATAEEIARKKEQMSAELANAELANSEERIKAENEAMKNALADYKAQMAALQELIRKKGEDAKATKEQEKAAEEAYKNYAAAVNTYNQSLQDQANKRVEIAQREYDRKKELADKHYDAMVKHYEALNKLQQEALKVQEAYDYNSALTAAENAELKFQHEIVAAAKAYDLQDKAERQKLALQRKYGKITAQEYKDALALLDKQYDTFSVQQLQKITDHQRAAVDAMIDLAGGLSVEDQIKETRAQFKAAREALKNDVTKTSEEIAFYEKGLAEQEAEQIRQIRQSAVDKAAKKIEDELNLVYKNDLRNFSDVETEKLQLAIEKEKQLIAERKKAGLETYEQEANLARNEAKLRQATLNKELQLSWNNAREQFRIKKEYIEKELELAELSAERRAELEEELAQLMAEKNQQRIDSIQTYADAAVEILNNLNSVLNSLGDRQVAKYEKENETKKKSLDKSLNAGLISQKEYDKQVAAMDEELDKKKAKIAHDQAVREKAMAVAQIAINTAMAVMKIWAEVPKMDFGVSTGILTAIAVALGAAQIAAVLAQPIPTAREGGKIKGAKHEQGGVLVNTEDDERIIGSRPAKAFPELLNLISYLGKHGSIPDTGYALRAASPAVAEAQPVEIDYDQLADKVGDRFRDAVQDIQIYTAIDDVRKAENEYAKIENSAKM